MGIGQKWIQKGAKIHWKKFADSQILESALPTVWIGGTNLLIDLVKQYGRIFSCLGGVHKLREQDLGQFLHPPPPCERT